MEMDEMELDRYITSRIDSEYRNSKKDYAAPPKNPARWWIQTACYLWRTYFQILTRYASDPDSLLRLTTAERTAYNACNTVRGSLRSHRDIDVLRMYYSIPKGLENDYVRRYANDHNIPADVIWATIRYANRAVIEELGLIDRKQMR